MNNRIQSFQDLDAWKKSQELAVHIYEITKIFPKDELFGLTNQIRRSVVSISSNIAESFGRQSYKEKIQFFYIALGSTTEVQSQIILAQKLKFINQNTLKILLDESVVVHKLLNGLIKKTKEKLHS